MPLSAKAGNAVCFDLTVNFPMTAGDHPVSVQVTHEWLQEVDGPAITDETALALRAEEHRAQLEAIASEKYDRGDFKLENEIIVVRIRSGDSTS